jgi:magnesium chelatase family protein
MSLARILSRTQLGLEAPLVQVELHVGPGLPGFTIVGLPAPVVRESRERVRAALLNSGYQFPAARITVNLAPVELSKQGGRFDLPIALGLLIASGQLCAPQRAFECYGELGVWRANSGRSAACSWPRCMPARTVMRCWCRPRMPARSRSAVTPPPGAQRLCAKRQAGWREGQQIQRCTRW